MQRFHTCMWAGTNPELRTLHTDSMQQVVAAPHRVALDQQTLPNHLSQNQSGMSHQLMATLVPKQPVACWVRCAAVLYRAFMI